MASKLFEILNEQETGRKKCIKNAKLANLPANDRMSYSNIADLFLIKNTPEDIIDTIPDEPPQDWPNLEDILDNAEVKSGLTPWFGAIVSGDCDYIKFTYSGDFCNGVLTSDGSYYTSFPVVHTWDKSQDINTSDGVHRWYIVYRKTNTTATGTFYVLPSYMQGFSTEYVDMIMFNNVSMITYSGTMGPEISFTLHSSTLKYIKCRDGFSCYKFGLYGSFPNLKILEIKNIKSELYISPNALSSNFNFIYDGNNIPIVNISGNAIKQNNYNSALLNIILNATSLYLSNCDVPHIISNCTTVGLSMSNSKYIGSVVLPKVTDIKAYSTSYGTAPNMSVCCKTLSLPLLEVLNITGGGATIYAEELDLPSLRTISLPRVSNETQSYNCFNGQGLKKFHIPSSVTSCPSADFSHCKSLCDLEIPNGWDFGSLYVNTCPLNHSSLIQILNALKDNSETGITRTITLGSENIAKLTSAELAIATDKGWTVN